MKKTKIIATLWPATDTKEQIKSLYTAWANVVRLNYSHSNYEYFTTLIENVQELNNSGTTNFWILTDTKWPEIRTKSIDDKVELDEGEIFVLTTFTALKTLLPK